MGQWNDRLGEALTDYANSINNPTKNMSNRAYGALINAAWSRQAEIDAERKRQLEVQKQKDADAALERKLKLQEMQFKMDALNEAREQAKNSQALLTTLAPYQPRQGFDSETGENVISGNSPLSPAFDALGSASGLNLAGGDYSKVLNDTAKAVAAESQDQEKYKTMSDQERQKAIDNVLAPYELNYETKYMTPDIYKANKIYDRNIYNTDAKLVMNQNTNETKENVAGINAKGKTDAARINANAKMKSSETAAKAGIIKALIKGEYDLRKIDKKQKELLKSKGIDIKTFSNIANQYLNTYREYFYSRNENDTPKSIHEKTLATLRNSYHFSEETINNMCKGFKILDSSNNEPGENPKTKAIDLLTK